MTLLLLKEISIAQDIESPPVQAFKPDTSLPKVNIPEFVITGQVVYDIPRPSKPSVEFDSTYFQNRQMIGTAEKIQFANTLSNKYQMLSFTQNNLFASLGSGYYQSTNYLVTGTASYLGYELNGGVSGYYTSGFEPNTMERNLMLQIGIERNFLLHQDLELKPLLSLSFRPSSFYLYGSSHKNLLRKLSNLNVGLTGSTDLRYHPTSLNLTFNRYSITDSVNVTQYDFEVEAESLFDLHEGGLHTSAALSFGRHDVPGGQSQYLIRAGALYEKEFAQFAIGIGLNFYQYRDDFSNGVGKLFPDFSIFYKFSYGNSVYLKYNGEVTKNDLSSLITVDRYLNGLTLLKYPEKYFNLTAGSNWKVNDQLSVTPEANFSLIRYLPTYYSDSTNDNFLTYSSRASILSLNFKGKYHTDFFSSEASFLFRLSTADSLSPIPNLPSYEFRISGNYKITSEFYIHAGFTFIPSRYSDITLVRRVSAVSLIDGRLSYRFQIESIPVTAFLNIQNLLNQNYYVWQGYREFPLTIILGLSSRIF
ncbi:MAG: hypothetical protein ACP5US_03795 [Candidatus Kryptoniota bacterium]